MIAIIRPLAIRAVTLFGVLLVVLVLLVVSLGATGFSDNLLNAQVNEELRTFRIAQSSTIKDPNELEQAVAERKVELERFYKLDQPWWQRLPPQVFRVLKLDLGDARQLANDRGQHSRFGHRA